MPMNNDIAKHMGLLVGNSIMTATTTRDIDGNLVLYFKTEGGKEVAFCVQDNDIFPTTDYFKFDLAYSARRGETYIYDLEGNTMFTIQGDDLPGSIPEESYEDQLLWVYNNFQDELIDHGLLQEGE
jgi:hypothetical protein